MAVAEQESIFQEKIEQLEAGEPLSVCVNGLSQEEEEAIKLIAQWRDLITYQQDSEVVAAYRMRLLNAAAQGSNNMSTSSQSSVVPWWKRLPEMMASLRTQRVWAGAFVAVFVGMCLLLFGVAALRLGVPDSDNELAIVTTNIEGDKPVAGGEGTLPGGDNGANPLQEGSETSETSSTELPPNTVFMPVIGSALVATPQTAVLQNVRGRVEIQDSSGTWTPVVQTSALKAGQHVRTGPFSSVVIAYFDGSQAILGPDSELILDELNAQLPEAGFRTVVMTQLAGESEHHVAFRNDGGSRYEVKTASGSGVARGTIFRVVVTPQSLTHFAVDEGKVDVTHLNKTVSVLPGQLTKITADAAPMSPAYQIKGEGEVSQTGNVWVIAGQSFQTDNSSIIVGSPKVGDHVQVEGHTGAGGVRIADRIILLQPGNEAAFHLTGEVEAIGDTSWIVAGQNILVNAETEIEAEIVVGDVVWVEGEILPGGALLAEQIFRLEEDEGFPFDFTGVVQQIEATAWVVSGQLVTVDEETVVDSGIELGDVVRVRGRILPNSIWLARSIRLVSPSTAEFSLTGLVQSINPWRVADVSFEINEATVIDEGIEIGDLVRVYGIIQLDGSWVATRIISLENPDPNVIIIIGIVTGIDPWSINGLPLVVNNSTIIGPGIEIGTQVMVHVLIRPDGSWLALSILPLHPNAGTGCITIAALVVGVNGNQIILQNQEPVVLSGNIQVTGDIQPDNIVIITICTLPDGTIIIISIIVIYEPIIIVAPPPTNPGPGPTGDSVTICHKGRTITVSWSGWVNGHSKHGDTLGPCR